MINFLVQQQQKYNLIETTDLYLHPHIQSCQTSF